MIEPIGEMPEGVTGFRIEGELTDSDYAEVLAPALRAAAEAGGVRLLLVGALGLDLGSLRSRFEAARSDPDLDLGHRREWRRVAIVADAGLLVRRSFSVVSRVIPVEVKLFTLKEEAKAKAWVAA